jgi:hypothetical protein
MMQIVKSVRFFGMAGAVALCACAFNSETWAQGLPRSSDPGSPATASSLGETSGTGSPAATADEGRPKRRANAGERDDMMNKGDDTGFDDYKGHKVALTVRESETAMSEYAKCVLKSREKSVNLFLKSLPYSKEAQKHMKPLLFEQCMSQRSFNLTEMSVDDSVLRAGLYDHLYRLQPKAMAPVNLVGLGPSDVAAEYGTTPVGIPSTLMLQRKLGDCVVRLAVDESRALLSLPIWDKDEGQRLKALSPVMAQCLPAGAQLKFSRTMLRGMLAESLLKFAARTPSSFSRSGS